MRPDPISRREAWLVWHTAVVGLPLALLTLAGPRLFTRAFWMDEVSSWLIASDADPRHALAALAGGVDTNPPLLYAIFHVVGEAFGHSPLAYRSVAVLAMSLAVVGLYFVLRQTLAARAATTGCVAFLAIPIILTHATEARFYGLFLAAMTWTAYWAMRRLDRPTLRSAVALALASVVLCGTHYFGAVALGCVVLCIALSRGAFVRRLDAIFPTAAGLAATLTCVPLLLSQRAALESVGGTWVADDFWLNLRTTLTNLLPATVTLGVVAVAAVAIAAVGRRRTADALRRVPVVLWASALYAVALLAMDRLVQPVMVPRYLIPALPALAAAIAAVSNALPARLGRTVVACLVAIFVAQTWHLRTQLAAPGERSALGVLATVPTSGDEPIVTDWLGYALPVWHARPDDRGRLRYLPDPRVHFTGFEESIRFERAMAGIVRTFYGLPQKTGLADVDRLERFLFLTEFPESIPTRFPEFHARRLGVVTFELERVDPSTPVVRAD